MKSKKKLVSNNYKPVKPYDISNIPKTYSKTTKPVFVQAEGLYLVEDAKGDSIAKKIYTPTDELLGDIKYMTKTELKDKYIKTYNSHRAMKRRVKESAFKPNVPYLYLNPTLEEFTRFLLLMGSNPNDTGDPLTYTLDRINPKDYLYSPDRCRWATDQTQSDNKTVVTNITYGGVTRTAAKWSEITCVPLQTILNRHMKGCNAYEILKPTKISIKVWWRKLLPHCDSNTMEHLYQETRYIEAGRTYWVAAFLKKSLELDNSAAFPNVNVTDKPPSNPNDTYFSVDYKRWVFNDLNHKRLKDTGKPYFHNDDNYSTKREIMKHDLLLFNRSLFPALGEAPPI